MITYLAAAAAEHLRQPGAALDARISDALRRAGPWPLHQGQWASGAGKCYVGFAVTGSPDPNRNAAAGSGNRRSAPRRSTATAANPYWPLREAAARSSLSCFVRNPTCQNPGSHPVSGSPTLSA